MNTISSSFGCLCTLVSQMHSFILQSQGAQPQVCSPPLLQNSNKNRSPTQQRNGSLRDTKSSLGTDPAATLLCGPSYSMVAREAFVYNKRTQSKSTIKRSCCYGNSPRLPTPWKNPRVDISCCPPFFIALLLLLLLLVGLMLLHGDHTATRMWVAAVTAGQQIWKSQWPLPHSHGAADVYLLVTVFHGQHIHCVQHA